ncbi:MAG: GNAT family N-acetyltransferase [Promethearchaeota archaeon]
MVEISILPWDQVDIHELAEVGRSAFYASRGRQVMGITVEGFERWLTSLKYDEPPQCIQVRSSGRLAGWLMLFIHDSTRIEINPQLLGGHPLVPPQGEAGEVLVSLLRKAKEYVSETGYTRLEMRYGRSGEHERYHEFFRSHYEAEGFTYITETAHMELRVKGLEVEVTPLPSEYEFKPLFDFDADTLFKLYSDVFYTSQVSRFFTQSQEERLAYFKGEFNRKLKYNKDTTLALQKGEQLIGFSLVRPTLGGRNCHLSLLGVHPDFRRQGLGKGLLQLILSRSSEQRIRDMSLSCEPNNTPAFNLFTSHGFKEEHREKEYFWSPRSGSS